MITDWEMLVEALRQEVQGYGALLNLFDQQQAAILRRDPDSVLAVTSLIEKHVEVIDHYQHQREAMVKEAATLVGQPQEVTLRDLMSYFSEPVRPLFHALIDEVNNLISRTRRRARQNQMLLARSIELSQQILQRLNPAVIIKTYSKTGRVNIAIADEHKRAISES